MQSLYRPLPQSVRIGERCYAIRTDYRVALRIFAAFEDEGLAQIEKQGIVLKLLYPEVPTDTDEALRLAFLFLRCGEAEEKQDEGENEPQTRLYSFTKDAPLICAAIQKSHGVDILAENLHWYRFAALFSDVNENTFFARLVYLRRQRALGKLTREERESAAALGSYMDVPQPRQNVDFGLDADSAEFMRLLGSGQKSKTNERKGG